MDVFHMVIAHTINTLYMTRNAHTGCMCIVNINTAAITNSRVYSTTVLSMLVSSSFTYCNTCTQLVAQ